MARAGDTFERVEVTTRGAWRGWLEANHRRTESVWLVTHKKHTGSPHVPYGDVVEEALAYGWIDSLPRKLDGDRSMLLMSPRRRGSAWSAVNKRRIAKLEAEGAMAEPGRRVVEAARRDGSWNALDEVEALTVPDDLARALKEYNGAAAAFAAFPRSARRGILEWIAKAKRSETRAARVAQTARCAAKGERALGG